jgi:hypothetical protein
MRAQYCAQHGINDNEPEPDPPLLPSSRTTSSGTGVERQIADEKSPEVDEPSLEIQNDEGQDWSWMYQPGAGISWPEFDYTPFLFQVPPSPTLQSTDARYSQFHASYPHTSDDTYPLIISTGTPAQEYGLSGSSMGTIGNESYPQYHPPHAVTTQQYQNFGLQDVLSGEPLGQDITDSLDTEDAPWQNFVENELLGMNIMAG